MSNAAASFTVAADMAGRSLADLIAAHMGNAAARPVLEHGGVWVGRHRAQDVALPVPAGAQITIHTPPGGHYGTIRILPQHICYRDRWLLALNKQPGWYTTPTPWDAHTNIRAALTRLLRERGDLSPVHLVHQLDRDTSGVLLCTTDPQANAPLQKAFDQGEVHKEYLCICAGQPPEPSFEARTGHGRGHSGLWRLYDLDEVGRVLPNGSQVKYAHTAFQVERYLQGAALLRAVLYTGRTHQIRLHLAALGHPLLGDQRYGGPDTFGDHNLSGHLLHAALLRLRHPITGALLDLSAPLPPQMAAVLEMPA
jgi:23S rRNA pseudouridine1911/1915/1917 synthase